MLNKVQLIGHVGADPVLRTNNNGSVVAEISVATATYWKDQQGQKQEKTQWHKIVMWNKLAETTNEFVKKGSLIYVEGSLEYGKYTDKEGIERYTCQVAADVVRFLKTDKKD